MTRYSLWREIIAASAELDRLASRYAKLDSTGRLPESDKPPRTGPPQRETEWRTLGERQPLRFDNLLETPAHEDRAALEPLQLGTRERLEALWKQLREQPELAQPEAFERVQQALVIHFDERILQRLPAYLGPSWTRLQTDYTGSSVGGEDFYRFIDQTLPNASLPSLVFEVYHFCLSHGFAGMHADNRAKISEYQRKLERRIEFELPAVSRPAERPAAELRKAWPVRRYYIIAAVATLLYGFALVMLSNYEGERERHQTAEDSDGDPAALVPIRRAVR